MWPVEQTAYPLLKKTVLAAPEPGGLEFGQSGPDVGPGLPAFKLGHAFEQQGQDTDFHMGLDAPAGPMVHRHHLDLGAFQ